MLGCGSHPSSFLYLPPALFPLRAACSHHLPGLGGHSNAHATPDFQTWTQVSQVHKLLPLHPANCFGKPTRDPPHNTRLWHDSINITCRQLHTTGVTTHAHPSWSISVQENPKTRRRCLTCRRYCQLSQRSAYGDTHTSLPHAPTLVPKVVQCIPSEIGSFNVTYPNNSSHLQMENRSFEHQLLPAWLSRVRRSWLAQLLRSDLGSLVKYMPRTNANAELYPKRPFIRLIVTPRPLL